MEHSSFPAAFIIGRRRRLLRWFTAYDYPIFVVGGEGAISLHRLHDAK